MMWYMLLFGLGLWLLCGYIGVALWHKYMEKYMEKEFQAKSELPFMYIFLGPAAMLFTSTRTTTSKRESNMNSGDNFLERHMA